MYRLVPMLGSYVLIVWTGSVCGTASQTNQFKVSSAFWRLIRFQCYLCWRLLLSCRVSPNPSLIWYAFSVELSNLTKLYSIPHTQKRFPHEWILSFITCSTCRLRFETSVECISHRIGESSIPWYWVFNHTLTTKLTIIGNNQNIVRLCRWILLRCSLQFVTARWMLLISCLIC